MRCPGLGVFPPQTERVAAETERNCEVWEELGRKYLKNQVHGQSGVW